MSADGVALRVHSLVTGYGRKQVVNGVTLEVGAGEIVALLGHNGAGKSTLLQAVFGVLPIWSGEVEVFGSRIQTPTPPLLLRQQVSYLPQGGPVFQGITVQENLEVAATTLRNQSAIRCALERVLEEYPLLKSRLRQPAGALSGGEKQVLAVAMAMVLDPRILLLDEPSLGLAPDLVSELFERLVRASRDRGVACLVAEQKVLAALSVATRAYVLRNGHVSFSGNSDAFADSSVLKSVFL